MPAIPAVFRIHDTERSKIELSKGAGPAGARSSSSYFTPRLYAYGIFFLFSVIYFSVYLPQGFSLLDDGYLLGLGQRVAGGEKIYSDFYFFRTPLSVYWQAGLIGLFGSSYTVLASKIIWALQITATVTIASFIYRRWMSSSLLALTLCASLVYSSMLLSFPWYTYDAMFFTAVFAYLFYERRYLPAGLAAGLAFICKQSFAALIPATFVIWLLALALSRSSFEDWRKALMWTSIGALSVVVVLCGILAIQSSLGNFWQNVFVLRSSVSPLSIQFMLIQNLPKAAAVAWPFTLLMGAIVLALSPGRLAAAIMAAAFAAFAGRLLSEDFSLVYNITALLYVILVAGILRTAYTVRRRGEGAELKRKMMFYAVSFAALYLAGLNYSGWDFANIGGVLALPAVIIFLSGRPEDATHDNVIESAGLIGRMRLFLCGAWLLPTVFALGIFTLAFAAHDKFPYLQGDRQALEAPFKSAMLAGMLGEAGHVSEVDSVVSYIKATTEESDTVFAFPDFTALNYLSSRPAWGRAPWHYWREFNYSMAVHTAERLRDSPPRVAIVRTHWRDQNLAEERFAYADLIREKLILDALLENMVSVDSIGRFLIMRPIFEVESIQSESVTPTDSTNGEQ